MFYSIKWLPSFQERDRSLFSRGLRTSFREKMIDTVYMLSGSSLLILVDGLITNRDQKIFLELDSDCRDDRALELGFADYITIVPVLKLLMYGLLNLLKYISTGIELSENSDESTSLGSQRVSIKGSGRNAALLMVCFAVLLLLAPVAIAQAVIGAMLALVAMPFVGLYHAIMQCKAAPLIRKLIEHDEVIRGQQYLDYKNPMLEPYLMVLGLPPEVDLSFKVLFKTPFPLEVTGIKFVRLEDNTIAKKISMKVPIEYSNRSTGASFYPSGYVLFRNDRNGREAFDAFKQLNMANYDRFVRHHPELDESERSDVSRYGKSVLGILTVLNAKPCRQSVNDLTIADLPHEIIMDEIAPYLLSKSDALTQTEKDEIAFSFKI